MRNFSYRNNRKLRHVDTIMPKNVDKKSGKRTSTPSQGHQAEGEILERDSVLDLSAARPGVLRQGAADPSHQGREIRKEKRCSKGWRRVYSTGLETKRRVYPHTRMTQGDSRTITVAEILKVVTRAPAQEEQSLPLRNIITKEHPHTGHKRYQKVKVVQEDTGSHGQKSKDQALRMTIYPSHGYTRKLICSLPAFAILISQKGPVCQVTSKHMMEARIRKITSRSFRRVWFNDLPTESVDSYDDLKEAFLGNFCQQKKCIKDPVEIHHIKQRERESTKDFVRRFKVESKDVKGAPEIMRISGFMHGITNPELIKRLHDKIPKTIDEIMRKTTSFLRGRWQLATKS
ncbi:reverse transcriptase domain-containing protein [Tanacetum coccineum]